MPDKGSVQAEFGTEISKKTDTEVAISNVLRKSVCVRPSTLAVSVRRPVEDMGRNNVMPSIIDMIKV
jgi:hypothetical protein